MENRYITDSYKILESDATTQDMKLMAIMVLMQEREISKMGAYRLFEKYGIFTKSFFDIDQDCCDFLRRE
jgi:hypothetical protein